MTTSTRRATPARVIMEVDAGAPYRIILDPGGYAEDYGWSDEDDDDGGDDDDARRPGTAAAASSRPAR